MSDFDPLGCLSCKDGGCRFDGGVFMVIACTNGHGTFLRSRPLSNQNIIQLYDTVLADQADVIGESYGQIVHLH